MSSIKVVEMTLAADVASGGTFTVAYPAGTSRGTFLRGKDHQMVANQTFFKCPDDFTISFGASNATVTYNGSTTLAEGSAVAVQLDVSGSDVSDVFENLPVGGVAKMQPVYVDLGSPLATDDDMLRASASIAGAGALTLLQTYFDVPRNIIITSAGNDSAVVFTVNSTDIYGNALRETITGANAGIAAGVKAHYKHITISASAASASTVKIGRGNVLGLPVYVPGISGVLSELQDGTIIGGAQAAPVRLPYFGEQVSVLAGTAAAIELIAPCAGVITKLATTVRAAVTTGGAVTVKVGTTDVVGLSITIADAATKGSAQTDTPTAGDATTVVAKGDRIQIVFADAFATAGAIDGYLEIRPTGLRSGTLVGGLAVTTKPTATNADVRGTYVPENAPDGSIGYALFALLEDPNFLGNDQYAG